MWPSLSTTGNCMGMAASQGRARQREYRSPPSPGPGPAARQSSSRRWDAARRSGIERRHDAAKLSPRRHAELREHLAEVVLDGPRADEQLAADLRVRVTSSGQPRDARLLGCELGVDGHGALA